MYKKIISNKVKKYGYMDYFCSSEEKLFQYYEMTLSKCR